MKKTILLSFLSLIPVSFNASAMEDFDPSKYKTQSTRRCADVGIPVGEKNQIFKTKKPHHPLIAVETVADDYGDWKPYSQRNEKENTPPQHFDLRELLESGNKKI